MSDTQIAELEGLIAELDKALDSIHTFKLDAGVRGSVEAARTIANRLRNQAVLRNQATPPVRGE